MERMREREGCVSARDGRIEHACVLVQDVLEVCGDVVGEVDRRGRCGGIRVDGVGEGRCGVVDFEASNKGGDVMLKFHFVCDESEFVGTEEKRDLVGVKVGVEAENGL